MSKIPPVLRCPMSNGLTGECAYLWSVFLANEADMRDDYVAYDKFKTFADQLKPKKGFPTPASVYYGELEDAITEYTDKYVYPGSDPQE